MTNQKPAAPQHANEPGHDYETAGASCGLCNGPMPCYCESRQSEEDAERASEADARARNKVSMPGL